MVRLSLLLCPNHQMNYADSKQYSKTKPKCKRDYHGLFFSFSFLDILREVPSDTYDQNAFVLASPLRFAI